MFLFFYYLHIIYIQAIIDQPFAMINTTNIGSVSDSKQSLLLLITANDPTPWMWPLTRGHVITDYPCTCCNSTILKKKLLAAADLKSTKQMVSSCSKSSRSDPEIIEYTSGGFEKRWLLHENPCMTELEVLVHEELVKIPQGLDQKLMPGSASLLQQVTYKKYKVKLRVMKCWMI